MMKNMTLSLLTAVAIGGFSIGSGAAMPADYLSGSAESELHNVRLVCDRSGRCYQTRRANRTRPYITHRHYEEPGNYGRPPYSFQNRVQQYEARRNMLY
jgi:hypothetical protein